MIGDTSNYPTSRDTLFNVYDENYTGYSISDEKKTINGYSVTLDHYAKEDSISISGFSEVKSPSVPSQGEFLVSDYAIPSTSRTGIDYNIGKTLTFHSTAEGNSIKISYTTPGDKITGALLNKLIDGINNIQEVLGTVGSGKNLDTGVYTTIAAWLSYFFTVFQTHTHSGAAVTGSTRQLNEGSLADGSISNVHINSLAAIAQSKLAMGILDYGIGTIPTGTDKYVDITSTYWETSNKVVILTRGADGYTDPGTVGTLGFDSELVTEDGFRVKFHTAESSLATAIPFTWILR